MLIMTILIHYNQFHLDQIINRIKNQSNQIPNPRWNEWTGRWPEHHYGFGFQGRKRSDPPSLTKEFDQGQNTEKAPTQCIQIPDEFQS